MNDLLYDVILQPGLLPGFDRDQVAANLTRLFSLPANKAAALLDGGERVIKREQQEGAARKYQVAMTRAGVKVRLQPCAAAAVPTMTAMGVASELALLPQEGNILKDSERRPPPAGPAIDISGLELAPAGSDLLPAEYRRPPALSVEPPPHLRLADAP